MIKSIQLINAPTDSNTSESGNANCYPPLGLLSIASYLDKFKHDLRLERIEIIDATIYDNITSIIENMDADVIGFSVLAANYRNSIHLAKIAKEKNKIVIFGNDYASTRAALILKNHAEVNYIIVGDTGEISLFQLIKCINSGLQLNSVPNLVWRTNDSNIIFNNKFHSSLKDLTPVNLSFINNFDVYLNNYNRQYGKWHTHKVKNMSTNFAKGCNWGANPKTRCLYCDIYDLKIDYISPRRVWDEVVQLNKVFGIDYIYEVCDSFTSLSKVTIDGENYFDILMRTRPEHLDVEWFIYSRAEDIDDTLLLKLKNIGVRRLNIGFDTGDETMLRTLSKGVRLKQNIKAMEKIVKYGFQLYFSIVLGSPKESVDSLENTIAFVKNIFEIGSDNIVAMTVSPLLPLPGSKAWKMMTDPLFCSDYEVSSNLIGVLRDKYENEDFLDLKAISSDWINAYCLAGVSDIMHAVKEIQDVALHYDAHAGGFGIPD